MDGLLIMAYLPKLNPEIGGGLGGLPEQFCSKKYKTKGAMFTVIGTYTWVCPPDVTDVIVVCVGGGGNGGGGTVGGGGGGGGAGCSFLKVSSGRSYDLYVGQQNQTSWFFSVDFCAGFGGGVGNVDGGIGGSGVGDLIGKGANGGYGFGGYGGGAGGIGEPIRLFDGNGGFGTGGGSGCSNSGLNGYAYNGGGSGGGAGGNGVSFSGGGGGGGGIANPFLMNITKNGVILPEKPATANTFNQNGGHSTGWFTGAFGGGGGGGASNGGTSGTGGVGFVAIIYA